MAWFFKHNAIYCFFHGVWIFKVSRKANVNKERTDDLLRIFYIFMGDDFGCDISTD